MLLNCHFWLFPDRGSLFYLELEFATSVVLYYVLRTFQHFVPKNLVNVTSHVISVS